MTEPTVSTPRPRAAARTGRRLALLWLVVAMLVQGFVVQTHGHFGADRAWSPIRVAATAVDDRSDTPTTPACPLCEERALFGAYLLGGSVAIAAPVVAAYEYVTTSLPSLALSAASHAWRSRAPPIRTI